MPKDLELALSEMSLKVANLARVEATRPLYRLLGQFQGKD
jgi:hypothetical protein